MLINDFYTYQITSQSDTEILASVDFNPQHDIYKGHFPQTPVTPGVCQVLVLREILSAALGGNYHLSNARELKFLTMHTPNEGSEMSLKIEIKDKTENSLKLAGQLFRDNITFLKIKGEFERRSI